MKALTTLAALAVPLILSGPAFSAPADHGPPPDTPVVGDNPKGPGVGGCVEDSFEPDGISSPQLLSAGSLSDMGLCNGDDFWRIDLRSGMRAQIDIQFSHALGDVDMAIVRPDQSIVAVSEGVADFEHLTYMATSDESIILRVYGYDGAQNSYSIDLSLEDYGPSCRQDDFEPNNSAGEALDAPESPSQSRLCLGDEDWFMVELDEGEGFDFGVRFDASMSPLSIELYDEDLHLVDTATPTNDSTTVVFDETEDDSTFWVRVFSPTGGFNDYTFSAAIYEPDSGERGTVLGNVQYEDQLRGADVVIGGATTRWLPARQVPISLIRVNDQRVIASAMTDDNGEYHIDYVHRGGGDVIVEVSASLAGPGYRMAVINNETENAVHRSRSIALSQLPASNGNEHNASFRFEAQGELGGAFNITDRTLDAFRFIAQHARPADLDLTVVWQRGTPHECTSCYVNGT
ncbi:MAG: hypothetical protein KC561_15040, partial [Myxococcales bacterium]|nr:hypothetical protein [Myxococcales bacterium]